ncbi:MAG: PD-(D/E)XK nuclease family transposase [Bacteroidia bacterium]|nr:PD-(D/E)XK nuclease family transposase [Bacteroidia bacterium]
MLKEKYINPFTDFGFKKLFGEEPNKDLLIDFLNEILKDKEKIHDLNYKKTVKSGVTLSDRGAVFDLYCENEKGEKFIVEMQKVKQKFFKDRSVYYSTFPIREQAIRGEWDFELKAIYTIGILDFIFEENKDCKDYFHWEVKLMETTKKTVFFDKLTYIYLEMPKFIKKETELKTKFDKWLFVLRHLPNLQNRPKALQERIFEKLFKTAEIAKFTPKQRQDYEDSLKSYRDLINSMNTYKEEGKVEGKQEEALKNKQDKIQRAKEGLKKGYSVKIISDLTGLTDSEIKKLR